mmetsp:Transcript_34282/g.58191  ORF Transcript_34282/g.58191 Transcript_34282/m.58191 type:complete len:134 (+) Transcript_34282:142-543(+)|eukprot:CAMPEP_0183724562 /NCGR_PEP_ID=MMETSP0737-20130205/18010_1 /TAXON_ID=385413 /ORGANISM="Thalassiosira miniscula, Strain CCMP1093" /LENGTH=133 /DNA_ID=CAMNT_0025955177 /DNA_START=187 /DNA_END=585 /DNA_ORIENTATION=+
MKWLPILSILPSAVVAFQQASPVHRRKTALSFFPENFDRAEHCAVTDSCNLEELEQLADDLDRFQSSEMGRLQNRDDYIDTHRVSEMLHAQSELKHDMEEYVATHHVGGGHQPDTNASDSWEQSSPGLGLGLW